MAVFPNPVFPKGYVPEGRAYTWTGVHTFSARDVHNAGISLGTSGFIYTVEADSTQGSGNSAFTLSDTVTRTQLQNVFKFIGTGSETYIRQYNTGEISVGYVAAPVTGILLGFLADTSTHPSWATTVLNLGHLSYVRHRDTVITPGSVGGVEGFGFTDVTTATIPSGTIPYFGVMGGAGSLDNSASYAGKKCLCFHGSFSQGANTEYSNGAVDTDNNASSVFGLFDSAGVYFAHMRGYKFIKSGVANPTNKPVLSYSARLPIQGMATSLQTAIWIPNRIITRSTASGHVNEDINNTTTSAAMLMAFPAVTVAAGSTLRATNAAHMAFQAYPAALAGPTWATYVSDTKEDSVATSYYGKYLDLGTNNPFGWYQHDGTAWRRQIGVVATGRSTAQTAAVASVAAYTVPASDASFEVSMNVLVTTATTHTFTCECAYTDEGNTARTLTMSFTLVAGGAFTTAVANGNGTVPYMGIPQHIRCKAATAITLRTQAAGTYTTVTYNVEGSIRALT